MSGGRFRKKPVVIRAEQWTEDTGSFVRIYELTGDRARTVNGQLLIDTLEGVMRASIGDWIIRGVKGEVYPCKPDIFEATYELVDAEVADG